MILTDRQIRELCTGDRPMIEPYEPSQVREVNGLKVISYGQSSMGYDIRAGHRWKSFRGRGFGVIDPKKMGEGRMEVYDGVSSIVIPPHGFVLGETVERFCIPDDVLVECLGKSTYARCGLVLNVTPLEPGWKGVLTIEISNTTELPAKVYSGEGVGQLIFHQASERPEVTYADRDGKYQDQDGVTEAKV